MIACIGLMARVTQNKKSIRKSEINLEIRNQLGNQKSTWKSEIKLEIRNQSLEIRNQVRNHGDLKSRTLFSKVSYPSSCWGCSNCNMCNFALTGEKSARLCRDVNREFSCNSSSRNSGYSISGQPDTSFELLLVVVSVLLIV